MNSRDWNLSRRALDSYGRRTVDSASPRVSITVFTTMRNNLVEGMHVHLGFFRRHFDEAAARIQIDSG